MDDLGITVEVMNLDNMEEGPAIQVIQYMISAWASSFELNIFGVGARSCISFG